MDANTKIYFFRVHEKLLIEQTYPFNNSSPEKHTCSFEHLYIVIAPGESLKDKFSERLDLAIPWPIQPEWAEYLLEAGQEKDLVQVLPSSGTDFTAGLRIKKNESLWQQVISDGLKRGCIQIA